jgi:hypothetical protein
LSNLKRSAFWALISIPISLIGVSISFALAHGSVPFLLVFYIPALIVIDLLGQQDIPELMFNLVLLLSQYIGYFCALLIGFKVVGYFKNT